MYQIQFKCNRWCNYGNYSSRFQKNYASYDEALHDFRAKAMKTNRTIRLVRVLSARKFETIIESNIYEEQEVNTYEDLQRALLNQ